MYPLANTAEAKCAFGKLFKVTIVIFQPSAWGPIAGKTLNVVRINVYALGLPNPGENIALLYKLK